LGLAICQGMVGAHGGRISVGDGIEGRGTCITLHLPLQEQPDFEN
jgi:two-component system sensor histidine kinase KdpD